jgi:inner membrane transporter RhtA
VLVASLFHYAGPSFAVLLFAHVGPLGVAWLRLASAALVLGLWRRPWRLFRAATPADRLTMLAWGAVLAGMNGAFYLALDLAPLATVASIEFVGVLALAAYGARNRRNLTALALAAAGVALLTSVSLAGSPAGLAWSLLNCLGFVLYVVLGHRVATRGPARGTAPGRLAGVDRLAAAVVIAAVVALPFGIGPALPALANPAWLLWAVGVGVSSTVIPYVADQVAMSRLPRPTYALLLSLLPVMATVCGLVVLGQVPTGPELVGIALVGAGVALHRPGEATAAPPPRTRQEQRDEHRPGVHQATGRR